MSGVLSVLRADGSPLPPALLSRSASLLARRGPDGTSTWAGGPAALCHALLSTSRVLPEQPLSLGGPARIVAHARLDAREELARRLPPGGGPAGASDAGLILRAYEAWGPGCVEHLTGELAFATWDERERRLFAATDRFATRPLYWARAGADVLVGNSVDALLAWPGVDASFDETALLDHLLIGYPLDPEATYYAAVRRLPEAHALVAERGEVRTWRYWTLPIREPRVLGERECLEEFGALLRTAVAERLDGARTLIAFSGGLDSGAIASAARDVLGGSLLGRLHGYTVVCDGIVPDEEGHFARIAAAALGLPLTLIPMAGERAFESWSELFALLAHPPGETYRAAVLKALAVASPFSAVHLQGDGGDEVLFRTLDYHRLSRLGATRLLHESLRHLLRHGRVPPLGIRTALAKARGAKPVPLPAWLSSEPAVVAWAKERLELHRDARPAVSHPFRGEASRRLFGGYFSRGLAFSDPDHSGFACEARFPFLDLRLVELLFALHPSPWFEEKHLVRRHLDGKLAREVLRRPKTPMAGGPDRELCRRAETSWLASVELAPALRPLVRALPQAPAAGKPGPFYDSLRVALLNLWLGARAGAQGGR